MAEVLTGVHAGMDLQVLAFCPRLGILKVNSHLFFTGRFGQKVRKERFPICSLLFVEEQRGNADICPMLM